MKKKKKKNSWAESWRAGHEKDAFRPGQTFDIVKLREIAFPLPNAGLHSQIDSRAHAALYDR